MKEFVVTVKQLVSDEELDHDDFNDNPSGEHRVFGTDNDDALNEFHATIPIACLDDFEITIHEFEP